MCVCCRIKISLIKNGMIVCELAQWRPEMNKYPDYQDVMGLIQTVPCMDKLSALGVLDK